MTRASWTTDEGTRIVDLTSGDLCSIQSSVLIAVGAGMTCVKLWSHELGRVHVTDGLGCTAAEHVVMGAE